MKKLYKQLKAVNKDIAEANTALSNIDNWNVSEKEKIQERRTMKALLNTAIEDKKVILTQIADEAGKELSKLCLQDVAA